MYGYSLHNISDGVCFRSYDIRPSGSKDMMMIKHLVHKADSYSHFLMLTADVEMKEAMIYT